MEQGNKNQYLLVGVVIVLLIAVFTLGISFAVKEHEKKAHEKEYILNQIYYSEYTLDILDDKYFVGYLKDKQINVIINQDGKEVFTNGINLYYDGFYKTKEDNYLFYSNKNNHLVIYLFNGEKVEKIKDLNNVSYAKPIVYTNGNIEYIVGFASQEENELNLYMLNDLDKVSVPGVSLLADDFKNNVYYTYNNNYLVVINGELLCGVIDYNGKQVISYKYKDIINTFNNSFIVKNKKNLYGIVSKNDKELVKTKYKAISLYGNYYLVVDQSNEMAVYDKSNNNLTGFAMKYDPLIEFDLRSSVNSIYLWRAGNNLVVVNNYLQDLNKTEYKYSDAYFIKNNKIVKTIKEIGFANNGLIYSYDKNYNITIYNSDLDKQYSFKIENVKKIVSIKKMIQDIVEVKYVNNQDLDIVKYYLKGKETKYEYGDIVSINQDNYLIKKGNVISLYNNKMEVLDTLEGKKIKNYNNYLIVDTGIYRIEKRS